MSTLNQLNQIIMLKYRINITNMRKFLPNLQESKLSKQM